MNLTRSQRESLEARGDKVASEASVAFLAIGFALSAEERHLVVLDDKLVHADADRMHRFARIVEEVAERCQVLIATCNELSYSSLEAQKIEVPSSGLAVRR